VAGLEGRARDAPRSGGVGDRIGPCPTDSRHESPEQASTPDSGTGELPGPATPNDEVEQVGADDELPPSQLTSLPRMPSPRQPPPAPKKKMTTALPVRQSTWVAKPSSYVRRLAEGEGSSDGRGWMPGGIPNLKWTHPDWQERQEHSTDSAFIAESDDAAAAAIGDTHRDPRSIDEVQSHTDSVFQKHYTRCSFSDQDIQVGHYGSHRFVFLPY
jgi:hypothetical protein